ncbi:MAG: ester cyclase [Chloroflexi bacterium]|nr:ester cyclase [Chloroflexota bacterium]MCI0579891.1 ester cyclase [Chloroflexota bacterium]MCI0646172.1 ester cyclase [Chloroflexota bacterium]MCI0729882.1 ester cyclase [Chloroflexota bacterium]
MSTEQNKAIVRRLADEVWNKGNLAVIDELVAEAFVDNNPPLPGLPAGREGFRQWALGGRTGFPDCQLAIEDLLAEGDRVALYWTFYGTHLGELPGLPPPAGKRIAVKGIYLMRLSNGQVVERWANEDSISLLQQLGVMPSGN